MRQSIELARVDAAGHDIITRALRRALEQDRCLDLYKTTVREMLTNEPGDLVIQHEVALHPLTPQVEVAVPQPDRFIHFALSIDVKHREFGSVEDLIAMGYSGNLEFERDFLGEGLDMINNF